MKKIFFKYIIIIIISLFIIGVYCYATTKQTNTRKNIDDYAVQRVSSIKEYTLNVPIVSMDTMNPIISTNQNVQDIDKLIFDSLLRVDEKYKLQLGLAKEYAKINGKHYVIKLKEDIIWHNGEKFTSKDVKYTIDKIKENQDESIYYSNVKNIQEVTIIDDTTINILLNEEVLFFEYQLTFPIIYSGNEEEVIGTGEYKIMQQTENKIILEKWKKYWKSKEGKINKINICLYNSIGNAYQGFKNGEIDILITNNLNIEAYIGSIGYESKQFVDRQYDYIVCNMDNYILDQKEIRQAIMYGINKNEIIEKVYNGKYKVANTPLDYGSYLNDYKKQSYSLEKAKETLIKGGWKEGEGEWILDRDGRKTKLQLNLTVCEQNEERIQVGQIIKEQLEQLGIKINLNVVSETVYNKKIQNKDYELLLLGMQTSLTPNLENYLQEDNLSNFNNEEIKSSISEVRNIYEENLLKQKYNQILKITEDEVPYISLYFQTKNFIYQKNLKGNIEPTIHQLFHHMDTWYKED